MISWDSVTNVVKDAAPILGAAISKANPLAGIAISLISQAFGAKKNDPEDLLNKINSDPEYKLKLKKIEYDHEESLKQIDSTDYKTEVDDRKDARNLQVNAHSFIPTFLAIGYFVIFFIIQLYCLVYPAQGSDVTCARIFDGLVMILGYFFGGIHKKLTQDKN